MPSSHAAAPDWRVPDMRKIPTLFLRDPANLRHVTSEVHPDCQWVIDGEGVPTRKYDGTCVMLDSTAMWWARREVKPGKTPSSGWWPVQTDQVTGKMVGWEPIGQSAFVRWHAEAFDVSIPRWREGTYELCGPKINRNPEGFKAHTLVFHGSAEELGGVPRDFAGLRDFMVNFPHEGIVWHHEDGRMAKLKRRDFH